VAVSVDGIAEGVIAIAAFVGALTLIAAAGSKPPFSWVGHWIGWLCRKLVGNPVRQYVRDTIRQEMAAALDENGVTGPNPHPDAPPH
jgi:hypothetical protein